MKQNFIGKWLRDISECNKLKFYSDIKSKFKIEPYLNLVENRSHKNALTRLRISEHSLHIETDRYKRYDNDLEVYTNTPKGERKCPICTDDIEDIPNSAHQLNQAPNMTANYIVTFSSLFHLVNQLGY